MPWKETYPMDQRRKFITDWLEQDWSMVDLCTGYGVSRKTGYKWIERFKAEGIEALDDRSRAPWRHPNATPDRVTNEIIALRRQHPFWGPRKLLARWKRLNPRSEWPCASTIGAILKRHHLVVPRRRRRRTPPYGKPLCDGLRPNDVWNADFKGWFLTGDGRRVDPLTLTDTASRFLLRCRAVDKTNGDAVQAQFTAAFQEFGLPRAIRTDNGPPFASVGLAGLSRLSVWLVHLGIRPERIRPGHPEENGIHERMHRTLKQQTAKPPKRTLRAQQDAFDEFQAEYNELRPHEALDMMPPAEVYHPSTRPFPKRLPEIEYPDGAIIRRVTTNGTLNWKTKQIFVSNALVGETVELTETTADRLTVRLGPIHLGILDPRRNAVMPIQEGKV